MYRSNKKICLVKTIKYVANVCGRELLVVMKRTANPWAPEFSKSIKTTRIMGFDKGPSDLQVLRLDA
jgi:hypothetical protein